LQRHHGVFDWLSLTAFTWPSAVKELVELWPSRPFKALRKCEAIHPAGAVMIAQYPSIFIGEDPKPVNRPPRN